MILARIFFGLLAITLGVVGVRYNFSLTNTMPRLEFFERNLGAGSSYGIYKLIFLLLILGGILYLTGLDGTVLNWLLSPLRSLFPTT